MAHQLLHVAADYLYIPLGGNRSRTWLTYRNLMLTMLLGGLWHGAAWTYIAWGFYHGAILCLFRVLGIEIPAPPRHSCRGSSTGCESC